MNTTMMTSDAGGPKLKAIAKRQRLCWIKAGSDGALPNECEFDVKEDRLLELHVHKALMLCCDSRLCSSFLIFVPVFSSSFLFLRIQFLE